MNSPSPAHRPLSALHGWCVALLLLAVSVPALTAQAAAGAHPFASHLLALQISTADPGRQARILSVANNMLARYGPDAIAIEVVAFGPGVHLLYADNPLRKRVESLMTQGVRFDACGNTLDSIQRNTGHRPALDPHVIVVPAGVARLLELHKRGYAIVQP